MKNREIERKFLVISNPPDYSHMDYMDITQGYIHDISNQLLFRLRHVIYMKSDKTFLNEEYFQTIKGTNGTNRVKYEAQIWRNTFDVFWPLCQVNALHKFRYVLPLEQSKVIHLDIYKNELKGLYTVDVEFDCPEDAAAYHPAPWFGPEITHNPLYSNINLAYHGKPQAPRENCEHIYSRGMNQEYPRKCIHCGHPEQVPPPPPPQDRLLKEGQEPLKPNGYGGHPEHHFGHSFAPPPPPDRRLKEGEEPLKPNSYV